MLITVENWGPSRQITLPSINPPIIHPYIHMFNTLWRKSSNTCIVLYNVQKGKIIFIIVHFLCKIFNISKCIVCMLCIYQGNNLSGSRERKKKWRTWIVDRGGKKTKQQHRFIGPGLLERFHLLHWKQSTWALWVF